VVDEITMPTSFRSTTVDICLALRFHNLLRLLIYSILLAYARSATASARLRDVVRL